MIRIAVCDDELCFVEQIKSILSKEAKKLPWPMKPDFYTSSGQLLYDVEEGACFDLLFLDIEMPETDGMDLAEALKRRLPQALVIFVTSHTKYAVKAFELSVFRYIPKSQMDIYLPLALRDACALLQQHTTSSYVIESTRKVRKIRMDDILYIYKDRKYSMLVAADKEIPVRKSLGQMFRELTGSGHDACFLMVERGYIVNLFHVEKLEDNELYLDDGKVLPVSRNHQKEVRDSIIGFWRKML